MKISNLFKLKKNQNQSKQNTLGYSPNDKLPIKNREDIHRLQEEVEALNILYERYRVSHRKIFIAFGISIFVIILLVVFILYLLIHHFKIM